MRKVLYRVSVIFLAFLAFLWLSYCLQLRLWRDARLLGYYQQYWSADIYTIETLWQPLRIAEMGNSQGRMVLFIHGSPGSMSARHALLREQSLLTEKYRVVLVDRPGYAGSYAGHSVPTLSMQSALFQVVLALNTHSELPIVVSHSLWSPIALQMAVDYPNQIGGLISIAGAVDPDTQIIWLASYVLDIPVLRYFIAPPLRVTNTEKLVHKKELRTLLQKLHTITIPTVILHGHADRIVPVESAYVTQKKMRNAPVTLIVKQERDHFLPFQQTAVVMDAIELFETQ